MLILIIYCVIFAVQRCLHFFFFLLQDGYQSLASKYLPYKPNPNRLSISTKFLNNKQQSHSTTSKAVSTDQSTVTTEQEQSTADTSSTLPPKQRDKKEILAEEVERTRQRLLRLGIIGKFNKKTTATTSLPTVQETNEINEPKTTSDLSTVETTGESTQIKKQIDVEISAQGAYSYMR